MGRFSAWAGSESRRGHIRMQSTGPPPLRALIQELSGGPGTLRFYLVTRVLSRCRARLSKQRFLTLATHSGLPADLLAVGFPAPVS